MEMLRSKELFAKSDLTTQKRETEGSSGKF